MSGCPKYQRCVHLHTCLAVGKMQRKVHWASFGWAHHTSQLPLKYKVIEHAELEGTHQDLVQLLALHTTLKGHTKCLTALSRHSDTTFECRQAWCCDPFPLGAYPTIPWVKSLILMADLNLL